MTGLRIWTVAPGGVEALRPRLGEILKDCVDHGASVGFLAPLELEEADRYWLRVERAVGERRCLLLVASVDGGPVAGTVQLDIDTYPNQPHRATVCKLLVHNAARGRGPGRALVESLELDRLDAEARG